MFIYHHLYKSSGGIHTRKPTSREQVNTSTQTTTIHYTSQTLEGNAQLEKLEKPQDTTC